MPEVNLSSMNFTNRADAVPNTLIPLTGAKIGGELRDGGNVSTLGRSDTLGGIVRAQAGPAGQGGGQEQVPGGPERGGSPQVSVLQLTGGGRRLATDNAPSSDVR